MEPAGPEQGETAARYGEAQVKIWRRSYDIQPPAPEKDEPRWPGRDPPTLRLAQTLRCSNDGMFEGHGRALFTLLAQTIAPTVEAGKRVIIAAQRQHPPGAG